LHHKRGEEQAKNFARELPQVFIDYFGAEHIEQNNLLCLGWDKLRLDCPVLVKSRHVSNVYVTCLMK